MRDGEGLSLREQSQVWPPVSPSLCSGSGWGGQALIQREGGERQEKAVGVGGERSKWEKKMEEEATVIGRKGKPFREGGMKKRKQRRENWGNTPTILSFWGGV